MADTIFTVSNVMGYFDHNATTPTDGLAVARMVELYHQLGGNPHSQHTAGRQANAVLEDALDEIAACLGAARSGENPDRFVVTSGATEANNLFLQGLTKKRVLVSAAEHASILEVALGLLEHRDAEMDTLQVDACGQVRQKNLEQLLPKHPDLVSVGWANHETGVIQDIASLAKSCATHNVLLHSDAAQAAGKIPINFRDAGVSAISISAHKFGGPVGVGLLLIRGEHYQQVHQQFVPTCFGGNQQDSLRPGTVPVVLVAGMACALGNRIRSLEKNTKQVTQLRDLFETLLREALPKAVIHAEQANRLPHVTCIAIPGQSGAELVKKLSDVGFACSVGAACCDENITPSPTLLAMGVPKALAQASLRFSFGIENTEAEIRDLMRHLALL